MKSKGRQLWSNPIARLPARLDRAGLSGSANYSAERLRERDAVFQCSIFFFFIDLTAKPILA